jgi:chromosome segregation ATPase
MPSWLSPHGALDLSSPPAAGREGIVRQLQQKVDELSVQKDTIEKYLRLEIETLKHQLDQSGSGGGQHQGQGHAYNEHVSSGSGSYTRNTHEIDDLRNKIRELTKENMDLKEEAMVEKIRHQKEITHLREKHTADIEAGNASRMDEIAMLDRRHNDAITALKKIHMDEIAAVKQRAKVCWSMPS